MIFLPLLFLLACGLGMRRRGERRLEALAAALVIFGCVVSLLAELQSLTGTLTPLGSTVAWCVLALAGLLWARGAAVPQSLEPAPVPRRWPELGVVALLLALTGAVALLSAPNSFDALSYHLPRIERWVDQGSLRPFAAHDSRQLFMPSWPEYAMLQLRLLSGGDHYASLVQWLGLLGASAGAALLAQAFGAGTAGRATAAALVATLPMAVAQASGGQTDLAATCWAVLAVAYGYRLTAEQPRLRDAVLAALALGLAVATKQTAILFAAIALFPAAVMVVRRHPPRRWIAWAGAAVLATVLLAGPQLARNRAVFGDVRGEPKLVKSVVMGTHAPAQVGINLLRNLTLHFGTPWHQVNERLAASVAGLARRAGVDPNDRRTTWDNQYVAMPWNTHEESAPNPIHLLLIAGSIVAIPWWKPDRRTLAFLGALLLGFVVFSAQLKWQSYNSRLETPWFAMALVPVALMLEKAPLLVRRGLLALLLLTVLPTALLNYTRPLLTLPSAGITPRPSILSLPRNLEYFLYRPDLAAPYREAALAIADRDCADVGVRAWPDAWAYPILALARSAGSAVTFRDVDVTNPSGRFDRRTDPPCLLLQLGPDAARPMPAWAAGWRRLTRDHEELRFAGVAVFAPPP